MRFNLSVPYADKEKVKARGAKWDPLERVWYIDRPSQISHEISQQDRKTFKKWIKTVPPDKIVDFKPTKWCPAWK